MSSELLEYVKGEAILKWKQRRQRSNKKSKNREAGRRSNSTVSSTKVDAWRRGIGFLSAVRRIFKLKNIDQITTNDERIRDIPFHKELLGHFER